MPPEPPMPRDSAARAACAAHAVMEKVAYCFVLGGIIFHCQHSWFSCSGKLRKTLGKSSIDFQLGNLDIPN